MAVTTAMLMAYAAMAVLAALLAKAMLGAVAGIGRAVGHASAAEDADKEDRDLVMRMGHSPRAGEALVPASSIAEASSSSAGDAGRRLLLESARNDVLESEAQRADKQRRALAAKDATAAQGDGAPNSDVVDAKERNDVPPDVPRSSSAPTLAPCTPLTSGVLRGQERRVDAEKPPLDEAITSLMPTAVSGEEKVSRVWSAHRARHHAPLLSPRTFLTPLSTPPPPVSARCPTRVTGSWPTWCCWRRPWRRFCAWPCAPSSAQSPRRWWPTAFKFDDERGLAVTMAPGTREMKYHRPTWSTR